MFRFSLILFFILFSLSSREQAFSPEIQQKLTPLGLGNIVGKSPELNPQRLLKVWDSVPNNFAFLPVVVWGNLFKEQFRMAEQNKQSYWMLKLGLPLAYINHDQTKFQENLPLLQYLHQNKNKLKTDELQNVLIKLEEEYRSTNNIERAISIRNERIENGFIKTFWEIYRDCGLYEAAIKDFELFVRYPKPGDPRSASYFEHLGDLYFENQQIDSARKYYKKGLGLAKLIVINSPQKDAYSMIGPLYWRGNLTGHVAKCDAAMGQYGKAIAPLLYDISFSNENPDNKIYKWLILSDCYLHLSNYTKAKNYIDSARKYFFNKTIKRIQLKIYEASANYFKATNRFDSAYYYQHLYSQFANELYSRIQKNQSVLLLGKLEIGKRRADLAASNLSLSKVTSKSELQQNQLILLILSLTAAVIIGLILYANNRQKTKSNNLIEQQNLQLQQNTERISQQNARNEVLLKEVHHRVKNNLQVMYSLLNLQKRRNKDADTKEVIATLQNRIQSMAMVHQNLYSHDNSELVKMGNYVNMLLGHLQSMYQPSQPVTVHCEIDPAIQLSLDKAISIGLILNEAVSNAFKYAFNNTKDGRLVIRFQKNKKGYIVIITDNGPGFTNDQIKTSSMGMKLIAIMCEQLAANYSLQQSNGVTHSFEFNY